MDVMPPGNKEVIRRVTAMFKTISAFQEENKMSARNIAIVMHPALFRLAKQQKIQTNSFKI